MTPVPPFIVIPFCQRWKIEPCKNGLRCLPTLEHLHIGKSTTAKAVKNLVSKGYVTKQKDEKDGRVDHLFLTDKGRKEAPFVEAIFEENQRVAARGLTETERDQLLFLMNKVLNNFVANNESYAGGGNEDE